MTFRVNNEGAKHYKGGTTTRKIDVKLDTEPPYHCSETSECSDPSSTMMTIQNDVTKVINNQRFLREKFYSIFFSVVETNTWKYRCLRGSNEDFKMLVLVACFNVKVYDIIFLRDRERDGLLIREGTLSIQLL